MQFIRIYYQGDIQLKGEIQLSLEASHHLMTVLRIKIGERIIIFNGGGSEYLAEVSLLQKKAVKVKILEWSPAERESLLEIELGQGISRGERMDYAVQKAVELGVDGITPLLTERCGVKLDKDRLARRVEHWQSIVINACEQSGRLKIPIVNFPVELTNWLSCEREGCKLVCAPDAMPLSPLEILPKKVCVLVGPEGGLSAFEIQQTMEHGFQAIRLGPRILRTETATVVALTAVQLLWGDFMH